MEVAKNRVEQLSRMDLGFGIVVVRDVPVSVCSRCDADWVEDSIAIKLEEIVNDGASEASLCPVLRATPIPPPYRT